MTPMQMQSPPAARTLINDRWCDYFSGTGYLGLQGHPALTQAAVDAHSALRPHDGHFPRRLRRAPGLPGG